MDASPSAQRHGSASPPVLGLALEHDGTPSRSPFEHIVVDAALEEVCRRLAADAAQLQADTYPAIEDLLQVRLIFCVHAQGLLRTCGTGTVFPHLARQRRRRLSLQQPRSMWQTQGG
jgi:hypothetical protein